MTLPLKKLSALLLFLAVTPLAVAQTGIGAQVGDPTGINLKFGMGKGAIDLAAGWNLNNHITVQGHYLLAENRLPAQNLDLRYFYGPGVFLKARSNNDNGDDDVDAGLSFNLGIGIYPSRDFEIFGQITPRLQLIDATDFDVGGAIGLRFYL